jgi:Ca2+-binding RTX toxin-like protein
MVLTAVAFFAAPEALAKVLTGTASEDRLIGTDRADRLDGRAGEDNLKGRREADRLNGGPG